MLPRMGRRSRICPAFCLVFLLLCSAGCLSRQLKLTTRRTVSTLPDLNYQQVIDNLAAAASNPGVLPYLAVAGQGSVQVTDNGNSTMGLSFPLRAPAFDGLRWVPRATSPAPGASARSPVPKRSARCRLSTSVPSPGPSIEILPTFGCMSAPSTTFPKVPLTPPATAR